MAVKPSYKQTEVGFIPEEWDVTSLGELTDEKRPISYGIVQTGPHIPNGVKCLRVLDVQDGRINKSNLITTTITISNAYKRTILKPGDLVMPLRGKVGDVALADEDLAGCNLTRGVALIAVRPPFDARYCKHFIASTATRARLEQSMNGSALQEIPIATLRMFKIALPPTEVEQQAIATALSDADALIESLEQLVAKKRQIKQGAMQELLTGQKRLPGFSGEWATMTVAELEKQKVVKLSRGQVISKKDIDNKPGDFPIYSSSIHNDGLFGRYGDFMFDDEMITWSVDGGGNFFHRRKHKFSVTNVCGFMRVDTSRIDYRFFAAELQILHSRKNFDYQTKAHPSVVRKEYEVKLPTLTEQIAIASILSDMDAEITEIESKLAKARQVKQGMMQELLTGRIRLV